MQLDPVTIQILWNRLITIVDEAATGLMRTAYTPSVKEYHDFCCALFDANAQMLSHSTVTTAGFPRPSFPRCCATSSRNTPRRPSSRATPSSPTTPGSRAGHLIDISIAAPIFHRDRIVGYTLCIVHHLDMGGRMSTLESKDMYEEGLKIPILKLYDEGRLNETVFDFMRANIRVPDKVLGDVRAQLVANNVCSRGLKALLEEYRLDGLETLGAEVIHRTESSLRRKIAALPDGSYRNEAVLPKIPGCDDDVIVSIEVRVDGDAGHRRLLGLVGRGRGGDQLLLQHDPLLHRLPRQARPRSASAETTTVAFARSG